ncbi:hypothetical protein [Vibrio phage vB_pir03]|nr:hypothetical protein [Vibrio phage vB_pir03]
MENDNKPNLRLPLSQYKQDEEIKNKDFPLRAPGEQLNLTEQKTALYKEVEASGTRKPNEKQVERFRMINAAENQAFWQESENYTDIVSDPEQLAQSLEVDGEVIKPKRLTPVLHDEGQVLGNAFLQALRAATKNGGHAEDYMYSSGFWLKIGDFDSEKCFRTASKLKDARDNIGIATNSILFSTDDVHIRTVIIDFILDHVLDSNLQGWQDRATLEEALVVTDTERLMGLALDAMYPDGYPLIQDCKNKLSNEKKCDYITLPPENKLDELSKLNFMRTMILLPHRFGAEQKRFLRKEKVTLEEVKDYQEKLLNFNNSSLVIGTYDFGPTKIRLRGKTPSYLQYKAEGLTWIANVVDVAESLTSPSANKKEEATQRNEHIVSRVRQVMTQRQMCWIERVSMNGAYTDSREDVESALAILAEDRQLAERVKNDIRKFTKSQIHGLCAIPNWTCPSCKKTQPDGEEKINLIPISMSAYFFSILVVRAYQSTI